jgi:hypothetical protein
MTPERCLMNCLSDFCLPGWPCETCEEGVGVAVKGKSFYCVKLEAQVNEGLCWAARAEARRRSVASPELMGWLEVCLECPVDWGKPLSKVELMAENGVWRASLRVCRICGCTDYRACEGGCYWVPDPENRGDLCSACLPQVCQIAQVGEVGRPTRDLPQVEASNLPGSGAPALKPAVKRRKLPAWLKDASKAVIESYEKDGAL